jgi:hypothetical protein
MNTSPASNPFTGLKGALAGLMSGGWMGLLLGLLFRRRIAPMLAALETLFAQWQAGTLAPLAVALPIPAAPVRTIARTAAAERQAAAPVAPRVRRRRVPGSRRGPAIQAAAVRVCLVAWHRPAALRLPVPGLRAPRPQRRRARCTKNDVGKAHLRTPVLLRCRIN